MSDSTREFKTGDIIIEIGGDTLRMVLGLTDSGYSLSYGLLAGTVRYMNLIIDRGECGVRTYNDVERNFIKCAHWNGCQMEGHEY